MKTVLIVALLISVAFARSTTKERISRLKCQEYNELLKKNNICNADAYPFVGAIGFDGSEKQIIWSCSGSLISDQYVLTVAHCITHIDKGNAKYVRLGGDFSEDSKAENFNIAEIIRHPDSKRPSIYNDIALFKLEKPVDITKSIQPACLYSGEDLTEYDVAGYSFWTKEGTRDKGILAHEKNLVASKEDCNRTFEANRKLPKGVDFDTQFCSIEGDITCELNSAGVFLEKDKELSCMQNIAGLVNIGKGICRGVPGLNVKVSAYVDWIESVVWPELDSHVIHFI